MWLGELRLIAWKDATLHTKDKLVNWPTTYDGLVEMESIISKNMIVKLVVEDKDTHFNLVEVKQAPATDSELEQIQQQSQKPIYYRHKTLGRFKYEKPFDWYTKKVNWANERGAVFIQNAESIVLKQQVEYLAPLLEPTYLQEVKQFAAKEVAPLTKEWAGEYLSAPDLLKKLQFKELVMHPTGDFTVCLGAGNLLSDHVIQVEGNANQGLKVAFI